MDEKSSNSKPPCNPTALLLNHGIITHNLAGKFLKPGLVSANLSSLLSNIGALFLGRKRHLLVDSLGLLLAVYVHSAAIQDRDGAKTLLLKAWCFGWLRVIWADGGYVGQLVQWVRQLKLGRCAKLQIIRKIGPGFTRLPKRWVVERTFAWLSRYRRLARDCEVKTSHSTAFIYVAACRIMARRLAKSSLD